MSTDKPVSSGTDLDPARFTERFDADVETGRKAKAAHPTMFAALDVELRAALADAQAKATGGSAYWLGARDAYQTVITMLIPTARKEASTT